MTLLNKVLYKGTSKLSQQLINTRVPLLIILGLYVSLKVNKYVDSNFIRLKNILTLLKSSKQSYLTGTGVLIILFEDTVIKLPLGKHSLQSLQSEYENYKKIKTTSLSNLLDYTLEKKENYFVMEKLFSLHKIFPNIKKITNQLSSKYTKDERIVKALDQLAFKNAFYLIKKYTSNKDFTNIKYFLEKKKEIKCIPMHGDLTKFNIMVNKKNRVVLIDLDRFQIDGFAFIDRIHFVCEYYAKKRRKNFFKIIQAILKKDSLSGNSFYYLLFYLIYRVGIEHNNDIEISSLYYKEFKETLYAFLDHHLFGATNENS